MPYGAPMEEYSEVPGRLPPQVRADARMVVRWRGPDTMVARSIAADCDLKTAHIGGTARCFLQKLEA